MQHTKLRLLTPGPTPLPEPVRLALARDMIHHRKSEFSALLARIQPRLQALFGTGQPVLPLSCSGTGAMQAAVQNLFAPGERVLAVNGGKFGQRWVQLARRRGLRVKELQVPWGRPVEPSAVEAALAENLDISGILVQYSETSTGVLHPVQDLGRLTRGSQRLLVVDGISGVGISPCPMEDWGIDCLLTGSQKGLMLPPGLALISLSPLAWDKVEQLEPADLYFDLRAELGKSRSGQTAWTSPVNLIFGLEASLEHLFAQGLEATYRRQWALTALARTGGTALGLEPLAPESFTWGLTSLRLPKAVDGQTLLRQVEQTYNVVLAGGQDHLKGRIVRIGHMGFVDWSDLLAGLYALSACLADQLKTGHEPGYLEQAMEAYQAALVGPLPQPASAKPHGDAYVE